MRLNKFLARGGVASRRRADELIQAATTTVNGRVVTDPGSQVESGDDVCFEGRHIKPLEETIILMLHKPKGVVTSVGDPQGRITVIDFVTNKHRLFPIGRLDKDSTGLLLLTNDGDITQSLLHPSRQIARIYEAVIDRALDRKEIARLKKGIYFGKHERGRAKVVKQKTVKKRTTVTLELREGKNREVRRMMERLKRRLFSLHRTHFGPLSLGKLAKGKWRQLKKNEIQKINELGFNSRPGSKEEKK